MFDDVNPEQTQNNNNTFLYIWIDILGFREELKRPENYNSLYEIRENFINDFSRENINAEEVISISDGLVLIWDLFNLEFIDIYKIFSNIGKLQIKFILDYQKVLRGAIAVGDVSGTLYKQYQNDKKNKDIFLISNGFLEAYKMETQDIKWPIIATTDEMLKKINNYINKLTTNKIDTCGLNKINGNNHMYLYFIDFLNYLEEDAIDGYGVFLVNQLNCYNKDKNKKIFDKYYWLSEYVKRKFPILDNFFDDFYNGVLL